MKTTPTVCLMLKAPRPGYVKTRLAEKLGKGKAVKIYRQLVEHQLRQLPGRWPVQIHFTPASAASEMKVWLGKRRDYVSQCGGNLGKRLIHATNHAFEQGATSVIFLGGDCPYVTTSLLKETGRILEKAEVVLGPASDGGYYLIGLQRSLPKLFSNINWSTELVLNQTMDRIKSLGLKCQMLEVLEDVDNGASWLRASKFSNWLAM